MAAIWWGNSNNFAQTVLIANLAAAFFSIYEGLQTVASSFFKTTTKIKLFPFQLIEKNPQLSVIEEKKENFPRWRLFFSYEGLDWSYMTL